MFLKPLLSLKPYEWEAEEWLARAFAVDKCIINRYKVLRGFNCTAKYMLTPKVGIFRTHDESFVRGEILLVRIDKLNKEYIDIQREDEVFKVTLKTFREIFYNLKEIPWTDFEEGRVYEEE